MPTQRLAPDALLASVGFSGTPVITDIDEDPDSPDAAWFTASTNNVDVEARVSFPSPSGNLTVGAGLQEFRALVRKSGLSGTGNPSCRIEVWENGVLVLTGGSTSVTSTTGQVLSLTWNGNIISNPANVECKVVGVRSGGAGSVRASADVGAVEWNVTYDSAPQTLNVADVAAVSSVALDPGTTAGAVIVTLGDVGVVNSLALDPQTNQVLTFSDVASATGSALDPGIQTRIAVGDVAQVTGLAPEPAVSSALSLAISDISLAQAVAIDPEITAGSIAIESDFAALGSFALDPTIRATIQPDSAVAASSALDALIQVGAVSILVGDVATSTAEVIFASIGQLLNAESCFIISGALDPSVIAGASAIQAEVATVTSAATDPPTDLTLDTQTAVASVSALDPSFLVVIGLADVAVSSLSATEAGVQASAVLQADVVQVSVEALSAAIQASVSLLSDAAPLTATGLDHSLVVGAAVRAPEVASASAQAPDGSVSPGPISVGADLAETVLSALSAAISNVRLSTTLNASPADIQALAVPGGVLAFLQEAGLSPGPQDSEVYRTTLVGEKRPSTSNKTRPNFKKKFRNKPTGT